MNAIKDDGLLHAAKGARGDLDGWLELHNEEEVRAAILGIADQKTLRDEFAAKAMQGDFAAGADVSFDAFFKRAASYYQMADAMLAAREAQS